MFSLAGPYSGFIPADGMAKRWRRPQLGDRISGVPATARLQWRLFGISGPGRPEMPSTDDWPLQ
jgi:hypothetical protein